MFTILMENGCCVCKHLNQLRIRVSTSEIQTMEDDNVIDIANPNEPNGLGVEVGPAIPNPERLEPEHPRVVTPEIQPRRSTRSRNPPERSGH